MATVSFNETIAASEFTPGMWKLITNGEVLEPIMFPFKSLTKLII
ncbi:hypothetical protein [Aliiglaciecola aliphaticivorans]